MKKLFILQDLYDMDDNEELQFRSHKMYIKCIKEHELWEVYSYYSLVGILCKRYTPRLHFYTTFQIIKQWQMDCYYARATGSTTRKQITQLLQVLDAERYTLTAYDMSIINKRYKTHYE